MPSPRQQSRRISHDNPDLLTRPGLFQSHSPVGTDKTLCLSSEILLLLLSHLFSHCPPSPLNHGSPPRKLNPRSRPGAPTAGSGACVHGPTAIQPASGWAACWSHPAGLKWVQAEGYRDCKAGEPTRHEVAQSL